MNARKDDSLYAHLEKTKLNLLTHSQNIYPYCVGITYLERITPESKQGFLITSTDFYEQANSLLEKTTKDINVIQYGSSSEIEDIAEYNPKSVFIFDSLKEYIGSPEALKIMLDKIYANNSIAIFIIDQDLNQSDINELIKREEYIRNMSYLSDTVCSTKLEFPDIKKHPQGLTLLQQDMFNHIKAMKIDLNAGNWFKDELHDYNIVLTRQGIDEKSLKRFFNIVYPYEVDKTIDTYKQKDMVDDAINIVIDIFGKAKIFELTPKFHELVKTLTMAKDEKHLILTGYPIVDGLYFSEYGGDLIYKLLTAGSNPALPPEAIMRLYLQDDKEKAMDEFNSNENYKILIINAIPPKIPNNIAHFHVVDSYLGDAFDLINFLYKNQNYNLSKPDLTIHLYYMINKKEGESEITYDSYDFNNFKMYIEKLRGEAVSRWGYDYAYKVDTSETGAYLTVAMIGPKT